MDGKITYHQQVSFCGKARCRRCREGTGHGPYWYAYQMVNGRTIRTYIGKQLPPELLAIAEAQAHSLAPDLSRTQLRFITLGQFRLEQRATPIQNTPTELEERENEIRANRGSAALAVRKYNSAHGAVGTLVPQWEQVTDATLQHQRVRLLLTCLASSPGRKLAREQILYQVWPDLDLDVAAHRLDRAVHSLRQIFEPERAKPATSPLLLTENSMVILADQSLFWIDADQFESCIARARTVIHQDPGQAESLLEEAAKLYRGDYLPKELTLECAQTRREILRRSWVGLMLELTDQRIAREAIPGAIEVLDRLLAVDATSEAAVQRMMLLLAQMGRRGEAIQVYHRCAALLQHDYEIQPMPQTRAIYERIRGEATPRDMLPPASNQLSHLSAHVPAIRPPSPPQLPAPGHADGQNAQRDQQANGQTSRHPTLNVAPDPASGVRGGVDGASGIRGSVNLASGGQANGHENGGGPGQGQKPPVIWAEDGRSIIAGPVNLIGSRVAPTLGADGRVIAGLVDMQGTRESYGGTREAEGGHSDASEITRVPLNVEATLSSVANPVDAPPLPDVTPAHMNIGRAQQSPLVGRENEMQRLTELLGITEATRGQPVTGARRSSLLNAANLNVQRLPQCVMLMGDVGMGKTRLAEETAREAKRHGWAVAWSRAYTQESSVPYRLWIDILRKAMNQGLWQRGEIARRPLVYQPLRHLLPELQSLLPSALPQTIVPPEQEQSRLWEATRLLLETITEQTTLLIVLDDIQWSDYSSCELLAHLIRYLRKLPIMFLCTCRESELPEDHPLRSSLPDLRREHALEELPVNPLGEEDMHKLLAHLPTPLAKSIVAHTSGNPFFAEELARELSIAGRSTGFDPNDPNQLPATIQAVLELRLARINQQCQRILERGAVLGRAFEFRAICAMASGVVSFDEDTMLDILDEALEARMLTEEEGGPRVVYHFWHPLLQTYLYEHLSHARRASLHRRAAQVLQDIYAANPAEVAGDIATHLVKGGGDHAQIAYYAELAADHAYSLSAYSTAEEFYRMLLAHSAGPGANANQAEIVHRACVLERLSESLMVVGKFADARAFYEQVLAMRTRQDLTDEAARQHEAQIEALLWSEIGQSWRYLGERGKAREGFQQGEEILRAGGVTSGPAWARIRYQESHTLWLEGRLSEALALANESLAIVESLPTPAHPNNDHEPPTLSRRILNGDPISLGRIYMLIGSIEGVSGQLASSVQHLTTALQIFERHDEKREITIVSINLGNIHLGKAEYELAQAAFQRASDLTEKTGDAPNQSVVLVNLGVLAARQGRLHEAERWYHEALDITEQTNDLFYKSLFTTYVATSLIEQGRLDEARPVLVQAFKISRARQIAPCTAFALLALGQLHLTHALLSELRNQAVRAPGLGRVLRVSRHYLLRARACLSRALASEALEADGALEARLHLARIALLLGELPEAQELAESALTEAQTGELVWLQARANALLGQILLALGERAASESCLLTALSSFADSGMRLEHARALQTYSHALLLHSEAPAARQAAREYLQEAAQVFTACHAQPDLRAAERLLGEMG